MGQNDSDRQRGQLKKIEPLGGYSLHWVMAQLAYEYKISPRELAELEPRMLWTMQRYLVAVSRAREAGTR